MNKLIPPHLNQKLGFFLLTALLKATKGGNVVWGKTTDSK